MLAKLYKMKHIFTLLLAMGIFFMPTSNSYAVEATYEEALFAHMLAGEIGNALHRESIEMVANTVVNRVKYYNAKKKPGQENVTVTDVLLQKGQYTGIKDKNGTWSVDKLLQSVKQKCPRQWRMLLEIARSAINGTLRDNTGGSTSYHVSSKYAKGEHATTQDMRCLYNEKAGCKQVHHFFYKANLGVLKHNPKYTGKNNITGTLSDDDLSADTDNGSASVSLERKPEPNYEEPSECAAAVDTALQTDDSISDKTMFADDILLNMKSMMIKINQSLGALSMLGQGLRCYSWDIAPFEVDIIHLKIMRLNFYIPGMLIGLTSFFLSMAIGMYFIDISFKLGFAVVFLPLSLSLWPFPPTKDKFIENISIVIHNAMLFACISIGVSYAIILVSEGILSGGWEDFWSIVDDRLQGIAADNKAYNDNLQKFTESFSIDTIRVLIIFFCLLFAFKIVSSSVSAYLNRFFGEGSLGAAENAMHHMGTQAMGTLTNATVGNVGRLARDAIVHQTGRGISALGGMVNRNPINTKFGGGTPAAGANAEGGANPITPKKQPTDPNKPLDENNGALPAPDKTDTPNPEGTPNQGGTPNPEGTPRQDSSPTGGKNQDAVPMGTGTPNSNDGDKKQNSDKGGNNKNSGSGSETKEDFAELKSTDIKPATAKEKINEFTRPTGHSLTVGNMFKAVRHPMQTFRTVKQLAKQGSKDWKEADGVKGKSKLVLKKSGQIVLRSVRGNAIEGAATAQKMLGKMLTGFGSYLEKRPAQWQEERRESKKQKKDINYDATGRDRHQEKEWGMTNDEDY